MSPALARVPEQPPARGLLSGKTAVVTAAAGTGIGAATARRMVAEGARVVLSDHHERRLESMRAELAAEAGAQVCAVPCDVTDEEQVSELFAACRAAFGAVDVLVNNAGLGGHAAVQDMTDAEWNRVLDVTLNGTFRCTRAAVRVFGEQESGGVIVNNASVVGWRAQAGQAHYAAAKAGVMALTRCSSVDAAPLGVRVNAVAPSLALHEHLAKVTSEETLENLAGQEAFGRSAEPWEVANIIVFLASDYSSYLTGEVVSASSQHP